MPAHVYAVVEYVERPQPKPGDAAHVGLGSGGVGRGPSCLSGHGRRSPPLELVRVKTLVKTEEKLRRRCLGPQMKTSARHPEGYGHAEPWISAVLRLTDCQHQPMRLSRRHTRQPTQRLRRMCWPGAWSRLAPRQAKRRAGEALEELRQALTRQTDAAPQGR